MMKAYVECMRTDPEAVFSSCDSIAIVCLASECQEIIIQTTA